MLPCPLTYDKMKTVAASHLWKFRTRDNRPLPLLLFADVATTGALQPVRELLSGWMGKVSLLRVSVQSHCRREPIKEVLPVKCFK